MLYDKKWDEKLPVKTENFKTAAELGLRSTEYQDLVRLLGMFEEGAVPKHLFNMRVIGQPECGTAGCLLGWAKTFNERSFCNGWALPESDLAKKIEVTNLLSSCWGRATPAHAAVALRNFLTTGSAKWAEVLANN